MAATLLSPPRPYVKFVNADDTLTAQGYDFLYGLYRRVGGSLSALNAATLLDKTWSEPAAIGNITPSTGRFTSLTATSYTMASISSSATILTILPTGTGSTMDKVIIGDSVPAKATFSDLYVTPTTGLGVNLQPSGTVTIKSGTTVGTLDKVAVGSLVASTGKFTTFGCNGAAVQTSYVVGTTLGAYAAGANGLSTAGDMQALVNKVIALETALKNNGICTV